jgi:hypothetical protein
MDADLAAGDDEVQGYAEYQPSGHGDAMDNGWGLDERRQFAVRTGSAMK